MQLSFGKTKQKLIANSVIFQRCLQYLGLGPVGRRDDREGQARPGVGTQAAHSAQAHLSFPSSSSPGGGSSR